MSIAIRPVDEYFPRAVANTERRLALMETRWVRLAGSPIVLDGAILTQTKASVTFADIPQTFSHLQVECYARGTWVGQWIDVYMQFSGDAGPNYNCQYLLATGATITAGSSDGLSGALSGFIPGAGAPANTFGTTVTDLIRYSGSDNNKTSASHYIMKKDVTAPKYEIGTDGSFWDSNAPITSITLLPGSGSFVADSQFTLIGIP